MFGLFRVFVKHLFKTPNITQFFSTLNALEHVQGMFRIVWEVFLGLFRVCFDENQLCNALNIVWGCSSHVEGHYVKWYIIIVKRIVIIICWSFISLSYFLCSILDDDWNFNLHFLIKHLSASNDLHSENIYRFCSKTA